MIARPPDCDGRRGPTSLNEMTAWFDRGRVVGDRVRGQCPLCGSSDGAWARVMPDGAAKVGCHGCDDWRGLRQRFDLNPGGTLHLRRFVPPPSEEASGDSVDVERDAEFLGEVYAVMAKHLVMGSKARWNHLARRRVPRAIQSAMTPLLAGLPRDSGARARTRRLIGADLRGLAPVDELRRVPGIEGRPNGGIAVLPRTSKVQYFEPWTDERGRITSLRRYMGARCEDKYRVLKGTRGAVIHVAIGCPHAEIGTVPWIFTEGWMKAEVAAHHFGCVAVAFPGVFQKKSWRRAIRIKRRLASDSPSFVAFDAEVWTTRPDFACAALELTAELQSAGEPEVGYAVWDAESDGLGKVTPKGIDDAICDGVPVRLGSRQDLAGRLGHALRRWTHGQAA